jgi:hypothetical protein
MSIRKILLAFAQTVADEAERNPDFAARVERSLAELTRTSTSSPDEGKRKGGRRNAAVFNPVEIARDGEAHLRERLSSLNLEQLLDIVAQYGMDPGKLVMKWKDSERVIDRIVELATARATKGDAFRGD